MIASEQRFEPFDNEVPFAIAQRVNSGGKVKQKFPVAGGLEVKETDDLFSTKEEVIGEQVAMDKPLGQPVVLILLLVLDLVIKRMDDMLEMTGKTFSDFLVERHNTRKTEAVLFTVRGVLAQEMK